MPEGVLLRAFRGVVGATVALHGCGLAHLDIKPQNILMRNDRATAEANAGGATLMDLGSAQPRWTKIVSARDARALEERCADKCTMPYRAPELFRVDWRRVAAGERRGCGAVETAAAAAAEAAGRGRRPPRRDPASRPAPKPGVLDLAPCDVWSLGCTLFAAAFGASPFESEREGVKRLAILSASYDLPPRDTHVYSDRVAELIASMLQEDPDARPTAREVELATAEAIAALEEEVHTAALGAAEVDAAAEKTPSLEPPPESPPSAAELSEWDPFGTGGNALDVDKPKLGAAAGHGALCDVPSGTEQVVSDRPAVETARPPRRLSSANLSPDVKALIQSLDASAREMEVDAETARSEAAGALAEHTKARLAVERAEAVQLERAARMAALMNAEVEGAARVNATSAAAEVREQSGNSASGTAAALFQGAGGGRSSPDVRGESADARAEAAAERAARARAQSAERWQTMGIVELAGEMAALKAARFELQDKMERQAAALRKAGAKGRLEMAAYDRALAHTDALIAQYEARVEELRLEDDV
jgi:serine/threonine protein kinase